MADATATREEADAVSGGSARVVTSASGPLRKMVLMSNAALHLCQD
mgnify:CR=1